ALAQIELKCEDRAWRRHGTAPADDYPDRIKKVVKCPSGVCFTTSVIYKDPSRMIRSEAACALNPPPLKTRTSATLQHPTPKTPRRHV
ncbi:hypothetical protein PENTCL1PPCAC_24249, partial [Pristionchus entomophagus]